MLKPLGIEGAWLFVPHIIRDGRGTFLEWFRGAELTEALGYLPAVEQANCSVSRQGALRGIHFADLPPSQAKYITCVTGEILDVVVDIRVGSPGFGQWEAVRLDETSRNAVYISEGLGHAFMALTAEAAVVYLCSAPYAPGREHGVHPLDPAIGISWPVGLEPLLSEKDATAPTLDQARSAGLLPRYEDCLAYAGGLRQAAGRRLPDN